MKTEQPGAFEFSENGRSILFNCPCGCGDPCVLIVVPMATWKPGSNTWGWNADREAPRLHPSIRRMSGCRFHGFLGCESAGLKPGEWSACTDSPPLHPDCLRAGTAPSPTLTPKTRAKRAWFE